jgi:hypothetical protein
VYRVMLLWVSAVCVSGCITVGRSFRPDALDLFQMNVTTKAEVQALLGDPWRVGEEDGLETWTYGHYRYSAFGQSRTRDLVLRFDDREVVVSYTYNVTDPAP